MPEISQVNNMVKNSRETRNVWKIKGLGANGPDPDLAEKLTLFGQFIGDWDIIEAHYKQADGSEVKMKGEVHFGWILGGAAIQDVWMGHQENSQKIVLYGTTIRFYDPKIHAWRSTWLSPLKGLVQTFIARRVNNEIILSKTSGGYPERWIFSQITTNSFRWHSEETHDNGKTWLLTEEMQIRKTGTGASQTRS